MAALTVTQSLLLVPSRGPPSASIRASRRFCGLYSNTIPRVSDWFRSITALGTAFAGVVMVTLGLATLIVSGPAVLPQPSDVAGPAPAPSAPADPAVTGIPGLGGDLAVTGDLEGTYLLNRVADGPGYGIRGPEGRVFFDESPLSVVQMNLDGLSFFPAPEDCTITPGNLTNAIGIGRAELACDDLTDIRGNGTVDVRGTIGLPLDLLAVRELPLPGGSVTVGDETWTFTEATLEAWQLPLIGGTRSYNLELVDEEAGGGLLFTFDIETRRLALAAIGRRGTVEIVPPGACELGTEELGQLNARTTVLGLTIDCPAVDVPGIGRMPIGGTVVVERLEWPE
jgi:hypothetical protein